MTYKMSAELPLAYGVDTTVIYDDIENMTTTILNNVTVAECVPVREAFPSGIVERAKVRAKNVLHDIFCIHCSFYSR